VCHVLYVMNLNITTQIFAALIVIFYLFSFKSFVWSLILFFLFSFGFIHPDLVFPYLIVFGLDFAQGFELLYIKCLKFAFFFFFKLVTKHDCGLKNNF
jgi:hypothetical protein